MRDDRNLKTDGKRLLADLRTLRTFTDTPGQGVTRFSYGEQDKKARDYLLSEARKLGCRIQEDALKNVRIMMPQNRPGRKRVVIGSHIDTVRNGGWLDGIYGVTGGLEVLRTLKNAELKKNLELVIFAEEEGSNFGSTMTGSKFIAGIYKPADLEYLKNQQGVSLKEMLGDPAPETLRDVIWDFSQIEAMLELHIEQGPVLERENLQMGIVDRIFGMKVIEVELMGIGNHAGASPMEDRKDALCAAAECILSAEAMVKPDGRAVVTVGKISVRPDCSNVIPEGAVFTLEVRDSDEEKITHYIEKIKQEIHCISSKRGISCTIRDTSSSKPLALSQDLVQKMARMAQERQIPHKIMNSGAVHDACMIAGHAPTGMIFVPSIDGRSHVPQENTREQDLLQGVQFLLETVAELTGFTSPF